MGTRTVFAIAAIFFAISAIMSFIGNRTTPAIVSLALTIVFTVFAIYKPSPHKY